ncbi:MAG: short-chain dehydrogenase [Deltaproteobacteria bacterium]|jgi:NAD(P)-dependent dehydrogenase (short-subunit alcohol dehydrogenase family)|nr:short-chain dehydrogenase [Deltaproteobacteria bacterium]
MDLGMRGKSVIVTGGSGGIGRGIVLSFAREGCNVVIAARDRQQGQRVAEATRDLDGEAVVVPTDVTNWDSVQEMVSETIRRFGRVDVLVNNAGGTNQPRPFVETPREEWQWQINLNIWGVLNCTRAVADDMLGRGAGSIVNITSNSALSAEAGNYVTTYGGTKGYVMALSKNLAYEWGPKGVRINCVAPGWIVPWEEDQVSGDSFWRKYGYEFFGTPDQMAKQAEQGQMFNVSNQPIKRIGRPEDIGDIAVFLASDKAKHITGQLISVSGGQWMP